jgi:arylsulfatase A-like enzyme
LILRWPDKIPAGLRLDQVVGLNQLPATIVDLLSMSDRAEFPGRSLAALWTNYGTAGPDWDEPVLAELNSGRFDNSAIQYPNSNQNLQALITAEWHLILPDHGPAELYAWQDDPLEGQDLAGTPEGQAAVQELVSRIQVLLSEGTRAARKD